MYEIPKITSRDNQRLIHARKVRDGHAVGSMFVEGKRLTVEALRSGAEITECFVSERFAASSENAELLGRLIETARFTFEISDRLFHTVAATDHSQGVILIAERPQNSVSMIEKHFGDKDTVPIALLLCRINNPSNLGAVLRTAEASGIAGVIVTENSADVYSPKALRASMGAAFRMPVWNDVSFEQVLNWAKANGLRSTATSAGSTENYTSADWLTPRLLIFGSEAHGLPESELARVEESIHIPMENDVESLNLAVAAGIILFEAKRQNDTA
jgi:TrmH family RNA methyltransferase